MKRSTPKTNADFRPLLTGAVFAAGLACGGWWMRPAAGPVTHHDGGKTASLGQPVRLMASAGAVAVTEELDQVLRAGDADRRAERLRELGRTFGAMDGPVAWQRGLAIPGLADREDFCLAVVESWAAEDPASAWEAVQALPVGALRTGCLAAALAGWARIAPAEALAVAQRSLGWAAREQAVAAVVGEWSAAAAPEAAAWAVENVSVPGAVGGLRVAVATWADQSPAAAGQWVAGLPPGRLFETAAGALVAGWARQAPDQAAAWLSGRGPTAGLAAVAADLAGVWGLQDPAAATAWAASLERTLTAREAAARALGEWAVVAPQDAAAWLAEKAPTLPALAPALHDALGASWSGQDAAGAAAWLGSLADPYVRADAAVPVFNTWAASDAAGLADWIARNPQSPVADEARAQLALTRSETAPAEAIGVALSLASPEDAADLGRQILDDWRVRDLVAADTWMVSNPKSADFIEPLE